MPIDYRWKGILHHTGKILFQLILLFKNEECEMKKAGVKAVDEKIRVVYRLDSRPTEPASMTAKPMRITNTIWRSLVASFLKVHFTLQVKPTVEMPKSAGVTTRPAFPDAGIRQ